MPPRLPDFATVLAVLQQLRDRLLADLAALRSRLPEDVQPTVAQIEALVNDALQAGVLADIRATVTSELVSALQTGKSPVKHDPVHHA